MKYAIFPMMNPIHFANIISNIVRYPLFFTHDLHRRMDFIVNKPSYFLTTFPKNYQKKTTNKFIDIISIRLKLEHPSHLFLSVQ